VATPSSITDLETSAVTVTASDADGDSLSYAWSATGGSLSGTGPSVVYTPPVLPSDSSFSVSVTVTDGHGGSATGNVSINVTPHTVPDFALGATVTVSSENTSTDQLGIKAVDGVIAGYPDDPTKEWATVGELAGAWITLTWGGQNRTVSSVVLYDRPNLTDHVLSGTLLFSDGSSIAVGALPNDGTGLSVIFSSRTVTWVTFRVDSAVGTDIGLAEIEVYPPQSATGVTESQVAGGPVLDLRMRSANPIRDRVRFELTLRHGGHLRVALYDVQGRTVTVFKDAEVQAGSISVTWNGSAADGRPVGQGVYFLQARIDGRASRTERIVVIR